MPGKYPRIQPTTAPVVPQFLPPAVTTPTPVQIVRPFEFPTPQELGIPALNPNAVDAAKWGYRRLFDGSNFKTAFDRFSVFFASAFARATGTEDADIHAFLLKMIDGDIFNIHTETVDGIPVKWFEYGTGPFRLIAFPGTQDFKTWANYARAIMVPAPDGPTGASMYAGVADILSAHLSAFRTFYASEIAANYPKFALIGHSIGGAIASYIGDQVDAAAPDTGSKPFNAMMSVYSFGAPAYWFLPTDTDFFPVKVRRIRTINPGDPVPDLTQMAIDFTNGVSTQVGGPIFIKPEHYAGRSWLINGRVPRRDTFWDSLDALRRGAIDAVSKSFERHRMRSYAASLEQSCKDFNDSPYPGFSITVDAQRRLTALGA